VSSGDGAELGVTLLVRDVAFIVYVLGAKIPMACLPEGALLYIVVGTRLIAFEAIGELWFASLMLLA